MARLARRMHRGNGTTALGRVPFLLQAQKFAPGLLAFGGLPVQPAAVAHEPARLVQAGKRGGAPLGFGARGSAG